MDALMECFHDLCTLSILPAEIVVMCKECKRRWVIADAYDFLTHVFDFAYHEYPSAFEGVLESHESRTVDAQRTRR